MREAAYELELDHRRRSPVLPDWRCGVLRHTAQPQTRGGNSLAVAYLSGAHSGGRSLSVIRESQTLGVAPGTAARHERPNQTPGSRCRADPGTTDAR